MKKILENNNVSSLYHSIKTNMSGIISYSIDGYEDTKPEDVSSKMFSMDKYEKNSFVLQRRWRKVMLHINL